MDGLIMDAVHIKESEKHRYKEKIWYLPQSRFCFSPVVRMPGISNTPFQSNHYLTLGNFGNPEKISDAFAKIWAQIMLQVPQSRLKLKHQYWEDVELKKSLLKIFVDAGVEPGRIEFYGASKYDVYLQAYAEIDLVLDTFPFTGGTTSCEALWLGIPVVSMLGATAASRQTASILEAIDEKKLIATDVNRMVEIVKQFAINPEQFIKFKNSIRSQIQKSSLSNGELFATQFHEVLKKIKVSDV